MTRHLFFSAAPFAAVLLSLTAQQAAAAPVLDLSLPRAATVRFPGVPGMDYRLEASGDLQEWTRAPLSASEVSPGTYEAFDVPEAGTVRRFYRIHSAPERSTLPVPERVGLQMSRLGGTGGSASLPFTYSYPDSLLVPVNDPAFGHGPSEAERMTPAELETARVEGMAAWRRIGSHGSCSSCHSPDGIDLALIGYSDADITRRALDHVSAGDAAKIVTWVKAQRQWHGITRPLHPLKFRPLQPGMEVLPGASHEARDLAFGNYLAGDIQLLWASGRIESRAQALAAQAQFRALDLRKLRTGIAFDLWSEDHTHGTAHRSASEWLPMMGVKPKAGREQQWHGIQDAYLANPTDAAFWNLYDNIDLMLEPVEPPGFERGQEWSLLKYKSVQIVQHMMRHQSLAMPDALLGTTGGLAANRLKVIARNPLFRAGDHVRRFPLQFDAANESTLFPPHLAPTLPASQTDLRDQNENFFRVWFWMGWAQDPALLLSDSIFQTTEGDYLYASLLARYKLHHAFVVAMTSVHKANAAAFFSAPGAGVAGHGKWAAFNPFMVLHHIERNRNEPPANDARRALHDRMFANTARLWIYLVHEDLERTGTVFSRELVRDCISFCRAWLNDTEPGVNHAAIDAVVADINARLNTATELRTDFSGDDLSGALPFN